MLCSIQNLVKTKRSLVKIKEMLEKIKGEEKIDVDTSLTFGNINSAIIDIVATINLFDYCEKSIPSVSLLRNLTPNLKRQYDDLRKNENTNIVEYIPVVEQLISSIELFEAGEFSNLGNYSLMKENFSGTWAYGNFLFPVNVLDRILDKIKKKTAFNLLDMNCGDTENLLHINKKFPYVNLYGISGKPEVRIPKEERLKINEVRLEVNSKILLEEPKHYPTMMMEAIKECCDNLGNINKAWLLEMLTEKDKSWLLILDFEGDRNYIFSKISQAARNYLGNMYLDMLPYEDDFAKNAVVNHKTFYNKKI